MKNCFKRFFLKLMYAYLVVYGVWWGVGGDGGPPLDYNLKFQYFFFFFFFFFLTYTQNKRPAMKKGRMGYVPLCFFFLFFIVDHMYLASYASKYVKNKNCHCSYLETLVNSNGISF